MPAGPSPVRLAGLAGVVLSLVPSRPLAVLSGLAVARLVAAFPTVGLPLLLLLAVLLVLARPVLVLLLLVLPVIALLTLLVLALLALLVLALPVLGPPLVLALLSPLATPLAPPVSLLLAVRLQALLSSRLALVPVDAVDLVSVPLAALSLPSGPSLLALAPSVPLPLPLSLPVSGFVRAVLGPVAARFVTVVVVLASVPVVVPFRVSALVVRVSCHGRWR